MHRCAIKYIILTPDEDYVGNDSISAVFLLLHVVSSNCSDGDLRLTNGEEEGEGLVEICNGSIWWAIYDDYWDANDAKVVCKQLGYPSSCEFR